MNYLHLSDIAAPHKTIGKVPMCQFVLNANQQVALIGADFKKDFGGIEAVKDTAGVKSTMLGKLSEQSFIFKQQLRNSLILDRWDFDLWPDPEVILLEKN